MLMPCGGDARGERGLELRLKALDFGVSLFLLAHTILMTIESRAKEVSRRPKATFLGFGLCQLLVSML